MASLLKDVRTNDLFDVKERLLEVSSCNGNSMDAESKLCFMVLDLC